MLQKLTSFKWNYGLSGNDYRVSTLVLSCYRNQQARFEIDRTILT